MLIRKIPDATPEIISQYALTDEQALLAKIRYNVLLAGESVPHRCERAMRGCGEPLRQIPAKAHGGGGAVPHHRKESDRAAAAKAAGLSRDQTKDALRVAKVPADVPLQVKTITDHAVPRRHGTESAHSGMNVGLHTC